MPKFEKRHYCDIAELLREANLSYLIDDDFKRLVDDFSDLLAEDNSNFDIDRFRIACAPKVTY